MKEVKIVYTDLGFLGIENQTRYNTEDILAIANWCESQLKEAPRRPIGSVLQFVNWRHETPFRHVRRWEDASDQYVIKAVHNWLELDSGHAWNVVKVVPPDRLFQNPVEALAFQFDEAPELLVKLLTDRLTKELGVYFDVDVGEVAKKFRIRINAERGSRVRAAIDLPARVSIGGTRLQSARTHLRRSKWRSQHSIRFLQAAGSDFAAADKELYVEALRIASEIERVGHQMDALAAEMQALYDRTGKNNYTKKD